MDSQTEEIKGRLDIVEFVGQYLQLKKTGQNWRGLCPFHSEKTPSFMVNPERQIYKCFGCGEGGDIFSFVEKIEALSFYDSLKFLAERAGIELKTPSGQKGFGSSGDSKLKLYKLNLSAARLFHTLLIKHPSGKAALEYAKSRGITGAAIKQFLIGYAPTNNTGVKLYLTRQDFTAKEMNDAGSPERFTNRLMFPIFDTVGNVSGFTGRALAEGQEPKYLNTRETAIFHKARILYGFDIAKKTIREEGMAVLVEGQMDVVMSHIAGVRNAVATSGTALTEDHLLLIRRQTNRVTLAFDNDDAGFKTTLKAIEMAWRLSLDTSVVTMPEGCKDAGDVVAAGAKNWTEAVRGALPAYDWLWRQLSAQHNPSATSGKKELMRVLAPIVAAAADPVEKDDYIRRLARDLGVGEQAVKESVSRQQPPKPAPANAPSGQDSAHQAGREWWELLALLTLAPEKIADAKIILAGNLGKGKIALIYEALFKWYDKHSPKEKKVALGQILSKNDADATQALALKFENELADGAVIARDIDERLKRIDERRREKMKGDFAAQIASAERTGDIARVKELVKQLQEKTK